MKRKSNEVIIQDGPQEFNQMALYLRRIDLRSDERDQAFNEGDLFSFYRSTATLLMNCIPRFVQKKKTDDKKIQELRKDLKQIGDELKSIQRLANGAASRNQLLIEEKLFEYNIRLNQAMFDNDMVYPAKETKALADIIDEDFK